MSKDILLSYPRSGNSYFRFLLEKITKRPIDGDINFDGEPGVIYQNDEPILRKIHFLNQPKNYKIGKIVFLIRNYTDSIISHALRENNSLEYNLIKGKKDFFENLYVLDKLDNEILIVLYENLMENPIEEVKRVMKFLHIEIDSYDGLYKKIDEYRDISLEKTQKKY